MMNGARVGAFQHYANHHTTSVSKTMDQLACLVTIIIFAAFQAVSACRCFNFSPSLCFKMMLNHLELLSVRIEIVEIRKQ